MLVQGVNNQRWTWLERLMVFFLIGYIVVIFLVLFGYQEPLLLVTGLVFLFGSFFVYVVVYSAKSDILKVNESNELLQKKNNELRKINLELDQFAYRTSHDLKAPITSLKGLIRVAELSSSPEEMRQCHEMMKDRLMSLEELIRDILDLSKNSRTEIDRVPVNIPGFMKQLIHQFDHSNGSVQINLDGPSELTVATDPTRLKMIVGNLLSNAIHYSDVSKERPRVDIQYGRAGSDLFISIKDNGVGIDDQYHDKIFDMFFRVSETSIGSGLGLYIVRETTERMQGALEMKSKKGVGSEFTVRLPA